MKEKYQKRNNPQEHHNPPKWWVRKAKIPLKHFYRDPQHTQEVTPKYHKFVNSFYTEQMKIADQLMPKEKVVWVETRVIPREQVIFEVKKIKRP